MSYGNPKEISGYGKSTLLAIFMLALLQFGVTAETIFTPEDEAIIKENKVVLSWDPGECEGCTYSITLSKSANIDSDRIFFVYKHPTASFEITDNIFNRSRYYWRVEASEPDRSYGRLIINSASFFLNLPLTPVSGLKFERNAASPYTPVFSWDGVAGARQYEIRIGTSRHLSAEHIAARRTRNTSIVSPFPLLSGQTYYFAVSYQSPEYVWCEWSEPRIAKLEEKAVGFGASLFVFPKGSKSPELFSSGGDSYIIFGIFEGNLGMMRYGFSKGLAFAKSYSCKSAQKKLAVARNGEGFITAGSDYEEYSGAGGNPWIVRIDDAGATTWSHELVAKERVMIEGIVLSRDMETIICGKTGRQGNISSKGLIVKMNDKQAVKWAGSFAANGDLSFKKVILLEDGSILVLGEIRESTRSDSTSQIVCIKLSRGYSIEWCKTLGLRKKETFDDAIYKRGGQILIAGSTRVESGPLSKALFLIRMNEQGVVIRSSILHNNKSAALSRLVDAGEGGAYVIGQLHPDSNNWSFDFGVAFLDEADKVAWAKTYGDADYTERLVSLAADGTGTTCLAGEIDSVSFKRQDGLYDSRTCIWLLKLDKYFVCPPFGFETYLFEPAVVTEASRLDVTVSEPGITTRSFKVHTADLKPRIYKQAPSLPLE